MAITKSRINTGNEWPKQRVATARISALVRIGSGIRLFFQTLEVEGPEFVPSRHVPVLKDPGNDLPPPTQDLTLTATKTKWTSPPAPPLRRPAPGSCSSLDRTVWRTARQSALRESANFPNTLSGRKRREGPIASIRRGFLNGPTSQTVYCHNCLVNTGF